MPGSASIGGPATTASAGRCSITASGSSDPSCSPAEDDAHRTTRSDLSLVLSADRRFARERYALRVFGVANPSEGSGFARAIASAELRDNLALEGSVGWFVGEGRDLVGRFSDSDFVYVA